MESVANIYSNLILNMHFIDINEISELNVASKSIIKAIIEAPDQINSSSLIKVEGVLDYTYEKINIGNWKEVCLYLRKAMTIASYLKLIITFKTRKEELTAELLKEGFETIDHGLLFGCPLEKEPKLLQKCADILSKAHEKYFNNKDTAVNSILKLESSTISNVVGVKQIETISCPSMESFYSNYIQKNIPVILENCIDHWPALTKWKDHNYLLKLAGLRTVPVELGSKYTDIEWTQKLMTLKDFINNHIYSSNDTTGYLAQYQLFDQIPELRADISEPEYCCFSDANTDVEINAWYGPKGTVSPLHHDDDKKNLLAQVIGEKQVFLFAPEDSEFLYPHDEVLLANTAKVDPREPDLETYSKYAQATPFHCILKAGQMLYIPPMWWHFIDSLSISFSVSFWWT